MSAQTAVNVLWAIWYTTWIGAVVWSGKTQTQMRSDVSSLHRFISGFGAILLFWPSVPRPSPWRLSVQMVDQRLWNPVGLIDWTLFGAVVMAFAFCWWARLHLGRLWSGFVTLKQDHRIVDTGPYGFVRHPIYSGAIFAAAMTALMRASPAALMGSLLIAVGFSMTARIEERFLAENFKASAYDRYRNRVGMLAPRFR